MKISEHDRCLLSEARQRFMSVYNYYYGDVELKRFENRLGTIIDKLDQLLRMTRE